jgi:hypothetical protein
MRLLVGCLLSFFFAASSHAATTTYSLPFIGTWGGYTSTDLTQTFVGDGFIGMYESAKNSEDQFASLFGIEETDYSRTNLQVNIAALLGRSVTSAVLSFELNVGGSGQTALVTGYGGNGALGYQWAAPAVNYGSVSDATADGANQIDVTALVAAAAASGNPWMNLHLQGTVDSVYAYTYAGDGYPVDSANVQLTVVYGDAVPVPVPGLGVVGLALLSVGVVGVGMRRQRRR